jgi:hypothetical protein
MRRTTLRVAVVGGCAACAYLRGRARTGSRGQHSAYPEILTLIRSRDGEAQCRSPRVPSASAPAKSPNQPDARVPYEDPKLERNAMSTVKYRLSLAVQGSTSAVFAQC